MSLIPRLDRGEYQEELLQLDDDSLQNLRESLTRPPMGPSLTQSEPYILNETRKRPREPEPG